MNLLLDDHQAGKTLRNLRAEIVAIDTRLSEIDDAELPLAEAEERLHAVFEATLKSYDGRRQLMQILVPPGTNSEGRSPYAFPLSLDPQLFLSLLRPELEQRALDYLREMHSDGALSTEERAAEREKLRARRAELEQDEEREILRLEDLGFYVIRRRDIDAQLVRRVWTEELTDGQPSS
jgi:hypothetical protein